MLAAQAVMMSGGHTCTHSAGQDPVRVYMRLCRLRLTEWCRLPCRACLAAALTYANSSCAKLVHARLSWRRQKRRGPHRALLNQWQLAPRAAHAGLAESARQHLDLPQACIPECCVACSEPAAIHQLWEHADFMLGRCEASLVLYSPQRYPQAAIGPAFLMLLPQGACVCTTTRSGHDLSWLRASCPTRVLQWHYTPTADSLMHGQLACSGDQSLPQPVLALLRGTWRLYVSTRTRHVQPGG